MMFVFALIVAATCTWIALPLFDQNKEDHLFDQTTHPIEQLFQRKEKQLQSIRDLDFDFETGKVSKQDYQSIRASIEKETVQTLKDIEQAEKNWREMEATL